MQYQPYHDNVPQDEEETVDRMDVLLHQVNELDQQLKESHQRAENLLQAQLQTNRKASIDTNVSRMFQIILMIGLAVLLIVLVYTYVQLCQILKSPNGLKLDILPHI